MAMRQPANAEGTGARRRYPFARLVLANVYDLGLLIRDARLTLVAFGLVMLAGTLYEHSGINHPGQSFSWQQAVYNTLQLLIFQTSERFPPDALGQVLFFLIPLLGLGLIVQSVLSFGRRVLDKGSRREAWQVALASTYRNHVIVCGLGRMGLRVVTRLIAAGYEPVIVEREWTSQFVARALTMSIPVIVGDAREPTTLVQAGLRRAQAVIADIDGDQTNIEIALAARTMRPKVRVVLRAFSEELDSNLERIFGPDSAFSQSALAAPTIAAATVSREIGYAVPVGPHLLGVAELAVPAGAAPASVDALERTHSVRVVTHQDAAGRLPRGKAATTLRPGDRLTLIGTLDALEDVRVRHLPSGAPVPPQHPSAELDSIIVCGLGKVGYRVVERLYALTPRPRIVVVHLGDDGTSFVQRLAGMEGLTVLTGDASDPDVLARAGIARAYSVAAVTSNDLINLRVGLTARKLRADVHLVVRVFSDALAEELNDVFEIHTTYSTSNLASPTLAAAAILGGEGVNRAFVAGGQIFSSDDWTAGHSGRVSGLSVAQIRQRRDALVLALRRNGTTQLIPDLDVIIQEGDLVTLMASTDALAKLRAMRPVGQGGPGAR
ncbi:MAG TPA: NAD-binding protein [Ktedonobacterales bacterium]|nr:NAD-binding protein [Ktedonobacterales bacterium]